MFKKNMKAKLERIFDVHKVTFDKPGSTKEQNILFVELSEPKMRVRKKTAVGKVSGVLRIFNPGTKMPFGWWQQQLHKCVAADQRDFHFHNFDKSEQVTGDIVERSCEFTYFFSEQFDPKSGLINSITLSEVQDE